MSLKRIAFGILMIVWIIIVGFGLQAAAELQPGAKQSVRGGGVTVAVTPLSGTDDVPTFSVTLDTHSVNLDIYDLKALSLLRDNSGKVYQVARVEEQGGGHHRKTVLHFPTIPVGVRTIELIIKDIAGIKERSFRWELK